MGENPDTSKLALAKMLIYVRVLQTTRPIILRTPSLRLQLQHGACPVKKTPYVWGKNQAICFLTNVCQVYGLVRLPCRKSIVYDLYNMHFLAKLAVDAPLSI